jgi:hypothetical protein
VSAARKGRVKVRLLFVDEGSWHRETVRIAPDVVERYDRLIDGLREDPEVLAAIYLDVERLAGAWVVDDDDD